MTSEVNESRNVPSLAVCCPSLSFKIKPQLATFSFSITAALLARLGETGRQFKVKTRAPYFRAGRIRNLGMFTIVLRIAVELPHISRLALPVMLSFPIRKWLDIILESSTTGRHDGQQPQVSSCPMP
jgi:hypothetical protein